MGNASKKPGRPPDISDEEIRVLRQLLAVGELRSTREVQGYLSRKVLSQPTDQALSLRTVRKCMRRADHPPTVMKTALTMPPRRIRELTKCPPEIKRFVRPLLRVVTGVSIRKAAAEAGIDQSTLRNRFRRVRDKGLKAVIGSSGEFKDAFFAWCTKVRMPNIKQALVYVKKRQLRKNQRTLHRYIMEWKDANRMPRRHWTCGGSKHS